MMLKRSVILISATAMLYCACGSDDESPPPNDLGDTSSTADATDVGDGVDRDSIGSAADADTTATCAEPVDAGCPDTCVPLGGTEVDVEENCKLEWTVVWCYEDRGLPDMASSFCIRNPETGQVVCGTTRQGEMSGALPAPWEMADDVSALILDAPECAE